MRYALAYQATSGSKQTFGAPSGGGGLPPGMPPSQRHHHHHQRMPEKCGEPCGVGDKVGVLFEVNDGKLNISFFKNGQSITKGGVPVFSKSHPNEWVQFHPFVAMYHGTSVTLNPQAPLPESAIIKKGGKDQVAKVEAGLKSAQIAFNDMFLGD